MSGLGQNLFARVGAIVGNRFRRRHRVLIRRIEQTHLFDADFYLAANPDVREAGWNPIMHFLRVGAREGRMPNPLFDPAFYVRTYPDVGQVGANPLIHYLESGARERRNPHPLFDTAYYLRQCPDVARFGLNPLAHYLEHGAREDRKPNPYFDAAYYRRTNPDVPGDSNPLHDFCSRGAAEGKRPSPLFDPLYYLQQNPDVKAAGVNPLAHFVLTGDREERRPCASVRPRILPERISGGARGRSLTPGTLSGIRTEGGPRGQSARVAVHTGQKMPAARRRQIAAEIELFRTRPRISVLVPVYNQTQELLDRMIASVEAQVYPDWELCIADDGSTNAETIQTLRRHLDPQAGRINIAFLGRNLGISGATNAAPLFEFGRLRDVPGPRRRTGARSVVRGSQSSER